MKIERITWIDSGMNIDEHWSPVKEMMANWKIDNMRVESAGILAYEDDDVVGLSHSRSPGTDANIGMMLIYKPNIRLREVLFSDDMDQLLPAGQSPTGILRDQQEGDRVIRPGDERPDLRSDAVAELPSRSLPATEYRHRNHSRDYDCRT